MRYEWRQRLGVANGDSGGGAVTLLRKISQGTDDGPWGNASWGRAGAPLGGVRAGEGSAGDLWQPSSPLAGEDWSALGEGAGVLMRCPQS